MTRRAEPMGTRMSETGTGHLVLVEMSEDVLDRARRYVAGSALDADDARLLLGALGLT